MREGIRVGVVVGPLVIPPVRSVRRARMLLRPLAEVEAIATSGEAPTAVDRGRTMIFRVAKAGSR